MILITNMARNLIDFNNKILMLEGSYKQVKNQKIELKERLKLLNNNFENYVQALTISQEVAKQTQQKLEIELADIVTSAISAIFNKDYEFKIEFVTKRNKTEANLFLIDEKGNIFNPSFDNGGGIVDVISFALRIACWRLNNPRTSSIMLYDEPLKFVSEEYKTNVIEFIKELCDKLDMQIIMISHEKVYIENADNIIRLK